MFHELFKLTNGLDIFQILGAYQVILMEKKYFGADGFNKWSLGNYNQLK